MAYTMAGQTWNGLYGSDQLYISYPTTCTHVRPTPLKIVHPFLDYDLVSSGVTSTYSTDHRGL
jgi:hypothetical protein